MPRPAGSLNKPKRALLKLLQEQYPDYHPVVEMAEIANDDNNDLATRFNAHKEVAQYVTPKLKAVEQTTTMEGSITHSVDVKYVDTDSK